MIRDVLVDVERIIILDDLKKLMRENGDIFTFEELLTLATNTQYSVNWEYAKYFAIGRLVEEFFEKLELKIIIEFEEKEEASDGLKDLIRTKVFGIPAEELDYEELFKFKSSNLAKEILVKNFIDKLSWNDLIKFEEEICNEELELFIREHVLQIPAEEFDYEELLLHKSSNLAKEILVKYFIDRLSWNDLIEFEEEMTDEKSKVLIREYVFNIPANLIRCTASQVLESSDLAKEIFVKHFITETNYRELILIMGRTRNQDLKKTIKDHILNIPFEEFDYKVLIDLYKKVCCETETQTLVKKIALNIPKDKIDSFYLKRLVESESASDKEIGTALLIENFTSKHDPYIDYALPNPFDDPYEQNRIRLENLIIKYS